MIVEDTYAAHTLRTRARNALSRFPRVYEALYEVAKRGKDRRAATEISRRIDEVTAREEFPLFTQIHIETVSRCNGGCSFCPVNRFVDPRTTEWMQEDMFDSIVRQLAEVGYDGILYFHLNNEPLLDKRIYDFIERARPKLPNATLSLWTNGTVLDLEKFKRLVGSLDVLVIDNYADDLVMRPNVQEIHDFCTANPAWGERLRIRIRRENEILDTRGAAAPNRKALGASLVSPCLYPFKQMNVRPDGKVSLCCNDALGEVTLGDLAVESLLEVWHGPAYADVRKKLAKGRSEIPICSGCDTLHLPSAG